MLHMLFELFPVASFCNTIRLSLDLCGSATIMIIRMKTKDNATHNKIIVPFIIRFLNDRNIHVKSDIFVAVATSIVIHIPYN